MSRRNRKRTENRNRTIRMPVKTEDRQDCRAKDLLFHPVISTGTRGTTEFDIYVPFLIRNGRVYLLNFIDSCGDLFLYVEAWRESSDRFCDYEDAFPLMKDCLDVQKETGVPYYFHKLDRAVSQYLYALHLLMEKGFLEKEKALALAKELYADEGDMAWAHILLSEKIRASEKERESMMRPPNMPVDLSASFPKTFMAEDLPTDEPETGTN